MKQNICVLIILFLFAIVVVHHSDARLLTAHHHVEGKAKHNKIVHEGSYPFLETKDNTDLLDLMGSESCSDEDEECMKRRMVAEAHLDYIYTQHRKP